MKTLVKQLADSIALALVLPGVLAFRAGAALGGRERAFPGWSQAWGLLPGICGVYLRRAFYRCVLPRCGSDVWITFGTIFSHPTARLGNSVYVGAYCVLGDVTLEDDVLLGSQVSIMNGSRQHGIERLDIPIREQPGVWPHITIGRDTWIGDRAVIMADVGRCCVIGAGSVVTAPIPDYAIAVGVPARIIRWRDGSQNATEGTVESILHPETQNDTCEASVRTSSQLTTAADGLHNYRRPPE
jgi:acetyltransferase-like isoleucine patch superfamily enzyme